MANSGQSRHSSFFSLEIIVKHTICKECLGGRKASLATLLAENCQDRHTSTFISLESLDKQKCGGEDSGIGKRARQRSESAL